MFYLMLLTTQEATNWHSYYANVFIWLFLNGNFSSSLGRSYEIFLRRH